MKRLDLLSELDSSFEEDKITMKFNSKLKYILD